MKAEDKAKEIAMKFDKNGETDNAVRCALICVDEILKSKHAWNKKTSTYVYYWESVKEHIKQM